MTADARRSDMGDRTTEPALSERVEVAMHDAACACDGPHTPEDDADINYSYDDVRKAVSAACRVSVAEELRRIVNDTTYGWAIGERLMARADALDPEGAQR